jgi:hypothetical protein
LSLTSLSRMLLLHPPSSSPSLSQAVAC